MCIADLRPGENGIVKTVNCHEKLSKRLQALGCIEGTEISLKNKAPLGDPIIINIRGFDLAIRKSDAKNISLQEELNDNCSTSR